MSEFWEDVDVVARGAVCALMALRPFYDSGADSLDPRIWSDPYILGIIHGMIVGQCLPLMGHRSDELQTGLVIAEALQVIGADRAAIRRSAELAENPDPSFARGYDDALTTTQILTESLHPARQGEADIEAARQAVPHVRASLNLPPGMEISDHLTQGIAKVSAHKRSHYVN